MTSGATGNTNVSHDANMPPAERDAAHTRLEDQTSFLLNRSLQRGHLYPLTSWTILTDNRPDYASVLRQGPMCFRNRLQETGAEPSDVVEITVESLGHMVMYINYGWETGIFNESRHLQERGLTREQLIELILFGHLQAGIRGLQHAYNAISKFYVDFKPRNAPNWIPEGWTADNAAFRADLDLSTRDLTAQDKKNVEAWFEKTIGYLPNSVKFSFDYHPEFYKWHRARWEVIFKSLPKQAAPYAMIRQQMIRGEKDGIREAVLLGKAWGMSKEWIVHALTVSAWYTGFEELYVVHAAVDDILRDW